MDRRTFYFPTYFIEIRIDLNTYKHVLLINNINSEVKNVLSDIFRLNFRALLFSKDKTEKDYIGKWISPCEATVEGVYQKQIEFTKDNKFIQTESSFIDEKCKNAEHSIEYIADYKLGDKKAADRELIFTFTDYIARTPTDSGAYKFSRDRLCNSQDWKINTTKSVKLKSCKKSEIPNGPVYGKLRIEKNTLSVMTLKVKPYTECHIPS